ncbi:hypothetical protein RHGRI_003149 [Rhododendron griersonianum]|uniref:DUF659 domain-containing protein n=1 Tax=Rhododendron griersonianum TaxID=479676 RepID=A0AAV6LSQ0_9ERIC|nr:hypothetical protein RHGRI_003149 [Rhododendron griersonianum]
MVQVIIDNAPVCSAAGALIEGKYSKKIWTPCVVHTLNLAFENICAPKQTRGNAFAYNQWKLSTNIVDDVADIENFIMNHSIRLAIFNEFVPLKLLLVADTRFASAVVMLTEFKLIKRGLQSIVISEKWVAYKEDNVEKAEAVRTLLLKEEWWVILIT